MISAHKHFLTVEHGIQPMVIHAFTYWQEGF